MSSEWFSYQLDEVGRIVTGKTPKSSVDEYIGSDVPFITPLDFEGNKWIRKTVRRISEAGAQSVRNNIIPSKSVLVTCIGSDMGKAALAGATCVTNQQINAVVVDEERFCPEFLYYNLALRKDEIRSLAGGSAQPILNKTAFGHLRFNCPPLPQQKAIVELLRPFDDRITLLRETNATLEAIAQALFKSWFVDFDPVRAKAEGRQPEGMDAATAALFPDSFEESELGEVPSGWGYVSLKEVTAIFDSKRVPLSGQERGKRKGSYPYYGAAALMDWVDDYLFDGVYLLVGEDGSVADTAGYPINQYVWGKIWVNNHAHVLQGKNGISTEHLMLALKKTIILPYVTGAVQAKLSQANMWRIPFLKPSSGVAEAFGKLIALLYQSVRHNTEQAQTLTQSRDTLLPRLISGQLRLPEAEAVLAEAV
ncbi:restriction endonuclease subunit S [Azotobacter beijerinckii]|uniref:restriction endonuclease subunit S n=1 Tax=Azotobacter beijerinckii TaxID=170623 RepID=UPI0029559BAB|nr:restriction endonuclease subunit S [Azotobacter beijerinckii]MDV7211335.1 restriction endonuclease subunit S [Azotobacter beijerinckii]